MSERQRVDWEKDAADLILFPCVPGSLGDALLAVENDQELRVSAAAVGEGLVLLPPVLASQVGPIQPHHHSHRAWEIQTSRHHRPASTRSSLIRPLVECRGSPWTLRQCFQFLVLVVD